MKLLHHLFSILAISLCTTVNAQPGSFDLTFNGTGKVFTNIGRSSCAGLASVVQPDGKIVAGGYYLNDPMRRGFAFARFNTNGSLDTTFSGDGIAGFIKGSGSIAIEDAVQAMALQSDGKIVAGGFSFYGNPSSGAVFTVLRVNTDGTLDTGFGNGGFQLTTSLNRIYSIKIQTDGKIVAAGTGYANNVVTFAVARYLSDGTPDSTFGTSGIVQTALNTMYSSEPRAMGIQQDGSIVVGGYTYNGTTNTFGLVRYLTNGTIDSSFGNSGIVLATVNAFNDKINALTIQTDGKIIVAGESNIISFQGIALARFMIDGSLDTTFSNDGMVSMDIGPYDDFLNSVALQTDGNIVVAGYSLDNPGYFIAVRFLTDGTIDSSFNNIGIQTIEFGIQYSMGQSLTISPNGKIAVTGYYQQGMDTSNFAIAQLNQDGSIDSTFDTDGRVNFNLGMGGDRAYAMAIQSDGKLVAVGTSWAGNLSYLTLTRHNTDGSPDTSFGNNGVAVHPSGDNPTCIALQPDGKILVGVDYAFALYRFNSDGTINNGFGTWGNGIAAIYDFVSGGTGGVRSIQVQPNGMIVAAGYAGPWPTTDKDFAVARFTPAGLQDSTFSSDGKLLTNIYASQYDEVYEVALQSDGKIVAAGVAGGLFGLTRYTPTGVLDNTFSGDGIVTTAIGNSWMDYATSLVIQPDGKIIAGGHSQDSLSGVFALVRYTASGALDITFDNDGKVTTAFDSTWNMAYDIALQADGKIIAAGVSGAYPYIDLPSNDFALARYNSNGSLDTSFGVSGKVITPLGIGNDDARSMVLQPDGKIVVAGFSDNGTDFDFTLVRYLSGLNVGLIDFSTVNHSLLIFPNPVAEFATLSYTLATEETISIRLTDMSGKLIQSFCENIKKPAGEYDQPINLPATLASGSYIIGIYSGNKVRCVRISKSN